MFVIFHLRSTVNVCYAFTWMDFSSKCSLVHW